MKNGVAVMRVRGVVREGVHGVRASVWGIGVARLLSAGKARAEEPPAR
jgi:hypothetical protein